MFPSLDRCRAVDWSPLLCNGFQSIGYQSIASLFIPMDRYRYHWNGYQSIRRRRCRRGRGRDHAVRSTLPAGPREGNSSQGAVLRPAGAGKRRWKGPLAHGCSLRDNRLSRILYSLKTRPRSPHPRPLVTTAVNNPQIVPRPLPWNPSSPTTPGASTAPSGDSSPTGATRWGCSRCRRTHSPWPATWQCVLAPAPPSPPCAWSPPPSPRPTGGPATNPPVGTRACAPL